MEKQADDYFETFDEVQERSPRGRMYIAETSSITITKD
jgi:hypothetical protein